MIMLSEIVDVVIGVDTHKHTHTAAVIDAATGAAGEPVTIPTTTDGYLDLLDTIDPEQSRVWAIEGANSYGAGLTRFLIESGERVIELDRPERARRRNGTKSDPVDAVRAGREALARDHVHEPRSNTGERAVLSIRLAARRQAVQAAGDGQRQLHALVIAAPEPLRSELSGLSGSQLVERCARLRNRPTTDLITRETIDVLRLIARRVQTLQTEADKHRSSIEHTVQSWRPDLLEHTGVGPIVAATVLAAWSHPGRVRNDAAFAMLAGTAPIPASSGQTTRHRLNRSGDRQLNQAIHTITLTRLRCDPTTRAYRDRRRAEGKTDREIKRCLKRYITRQLFKQLQQPLDNT